MIASLRRRHRRVLTSLGLVLPVVFLSALAMRQEPQLMSSLQGLSGKTRRPSQWPIQREPLDMRGSFEGLVIPAQEVPSEPVLRYTETFEEGKDVLERCAVEVVLPASNVPDTYVYWVETFDPDNMSLPAGAKLIGGPLGYGEAANYSFRLTPEERLGAGHLLLYSVAHMRIVASEAVEPMRIEGGGIY